MRQFVKLESLRNVLLTLFCLTFYLNSVHAGGTLIWGMSADVGGLDPNPRIEASSHIQLGHAFENLAQRDWGYEKTEFGTSPLPLIGKLATSWHWEGVDLVFNIRKGVKFHDGSDLDANAIEFNIRRWWDKDFKYYYAPAATGPSFTMGFVKGVKVLSKYQIALNFGENRNWNWLDFLGEMTFWAMVSPKAIKEFGNEAIAKNPKAASGTGPYVITNYEPGKKLVLEKNVNYWGEKPHLDKIIFRFIPDSAARVAALLSGEVHIIDELDPDLMDRVRQSNVAKVYLPGKPNAFSILPNVSQPPFNDINVREAASIAIDRNAIANGLLLGSAKPAKGQLGLGNAAHNPDLPVIGYDPERAKKLLKEAGYPNGFSIKVRVPGPGCGMPKTVEVMEAVQGYWLQVGIKAEILPMEWVEYVTWWISEGVPKGSKYAAAPMCTGFGTPYVLEWYNATHSQLPNGVNIRFYSNKNLDQIFANGSSAEKYEDYIRIYRDIASSIVYQDKVVIPIFYGLNPFGVSNKVLNWQPNTSWQQLLVKAKIK